MIQSTSMHVNVRKELEPAGSLGGRMAQIREAAGFTQTEMAEALGRSVRAVKTWEADDAIPRADDLAKWVQMCGADLSEVLFGLFRWMTSVLAA